MCSHKLHLEKHESTAKFCYEKLQQRCQTQLLQRHRVYNNDYAILRPSQVNLLEQIFILAGQQTHNFQTPEVQKTLQGQTVHMEDKASHTSVYYPLSACLMPESSTGTRDFED